MHDPANVTLDEHGYRYCFPTQMLELIVEFEEVKYEDSASFVFVFVTRNARAAQERLRICFVGLGGIEKCEPILVDQDENGVGDFAGQGLITIQVLDTVEDFRIGQVLPLMCDLLLYSENGRISRALVLY